jgi:hypothetical protein
MAIQDVKAIARKMQNVLEQYDDKASYNKLLHLVSRWYGYDNFHTLSAYAIDNNIELKPEPLKLEQS